MDSWCHKCGDDIENDDDIECSACMNEYCKLTERDYLRTLLDGMASAQEQCVSPEAHNILKAFIQSVDGRIQAIGQSNVRKL